MLYWLLIVVGMIFLSISLSNPVYNLVSKKHLKLKIISQIIFRIILFFIGLIIILGGLFIESVN